MNTKVDLFRRILDPIFVLFENMGLPVILVPFLLGTFVVIPYFISKIKKKSKIDYRFYGVAIGYILLILITILSIGKEIRI